MIIIDEWDALFREAPENTELQKIYIQLLRALFKGIQVSRFLCGAYMTGILPIKNMERSRPLPILPNLRCLSRDRWHPMWVLQRMR